METRYRTRIYAHYVAGRSTLLAPMTLDGLTPRRPYLRKMTRDYFPSDKGAAVLDLGCGHGAILHFARQAGYKNIRGVDASPEQVEAAHRLGIDSVNQGD